MKIIQSFWSKPSLYSTDDKNARYNGGWLSKKYAFYSYALSAMTIKKYYNNLELYTDDVGFNLFNNILQLPYNKIHISLNTLNSYNPKLWAIGKITACSIQEEPFIHIDNDIFLWEKINYKIANYDLITQNLEIDYPNYSSAFNFINKKFRSIPNEITTSINHNKKIIAYNAGIIGGTEINFFKDLKTKAFNFIDDNFDKMEGMDIGNFNTIFEQQLGYAIAEKQQLKIQYLYNDVKPNFVEVTDFFSVPVYSKYVHCVGFTKKSLLMTEQIEARLAYEFPTYYKELNLRLNEYFKSEEFTKSSISKERLKFLFKYFKFLDNSENDDILSTKFQINNKCKIKDDDNGNSSIEYRVPQLENKKDNLELKGWNSILLYFQKPTTIKELYNELITDKEVVKNFKSPDILKRSLILFILEKTLNYEILVPKI